MKKNFKIRVGIDPGKNGAIAIFIDDILKSVFPLPLVGKGSKAVVDEAALKNIIKDFRESEDIFVCLENVHAHQMSGASSAFNFGDNCGLIRGMLIAFEIPFEKTLAKQWQELAWNGVTKVFEPDKYRKKKNCDEKVKVKGKVDTKATSMIAAQRLFPKQSFIEPTATERKQSLHDGMVDASLIGYYCTKKFL